MQDKDKKIQEIQILEQNLQNLLLQKQAFQMEISETIAAKREIEMAGEDVFKNHRAINDKIRQVKDKRRVIQQRKAP